MKSIARENTKKAQQVLQELFLLDVKHVCLCPSSRNAPLVAALLANPEQFQVYTFFEERSAAFFALGKIRSTGKPVAVCTTSGTAVGELLPATMEAYYAGLPLILLTADRPTRYRGSGAPQAAEQLGIFGVYVSHSIDVEQNFEEILLLRERIRSLHHPLGIPLHINVCFDEPLLEEAGNLDLYRFPGSIEDPVVSVLDHSHQRKSTFLIEQVRQDTTSFSTAQSEQMPDIEASEDSIAKGDVFFETVTRPWVIVSALQSSERESVVQLLLVWQVPVYLESLSGLREDVRLQHLRLYVGDRSFERASEAGYRMDGVIRIGGVPLLRFWRDLDLHLSHLPVLSISALGFSGLGRPSCLLQGHLESLCCLLSEKRATPFQNVPFPHPWMQADRNRYQAILALFEEEPHSEPALVAQLSERLPQFSRVYLGNSMPIRQWDLGATCEPRNFEVWGSRGLNGIDGQISTFLGYAQKGPQNWGIIGDLTALYDLPGPWVLSQLELEAIAVSLVVINNQGGRIFEQFFPQKEFQNRHSFSFAPWAAFWGISYEVWSEIPFSIVDPGHSRLIELRPCLESTQRFWKKYKMSPAS